MTSKHIGRRGHLELADDTEVIGTIVGVGEDQWGPKILFLRTKKGTRRDPWKVGTTQWWGLSYFIEEINPR